MRKSPIIVIGMHRSGTTMLIKLLEQLGLFVGERKRKNYESTFFQELNRWMMAQANTSWDFPLNYRFTDDYFREHIKRVSLQHFKGLKRVKYLGNTKLLRYADLQNLDFAWGWKDPINTITLQTWLDIFPDAKVIHIYRNPFDVAASLRKREQHWQERFELNSRTRLKERALSQRWLYNQSFRVLDLNEGVALWEEYVQLAQAFTAQRPEQSLTIRFESLLDDPLSHLEQLNAFAKLGAESATVRKAAEGIDAQRKFAFTESPDLVALFHAYKQNDLVTQLGYSDVI